MKVVHVNTLARGGAARAAIRLHQGLLGLDIESLFFKKGNGTDGDETMLGFRAAPGLLPRLRHHVQSRRIAADYAAYRSTRPEGLEMFSDDRCEYGVEVVRQLPDCDIVHLHWIAGLVDYTSFFAALHQPVVWTLHDMNPFTGGCHYSNGCERFSGMCGSCPQLGSMQQDDLANQIWKRKQAAYSKLYSGQMHIVTPSRWLRDQVEAGALLQGFSVSVIANGVDTARFSPRDAAGMRAAFGIPAEAGIVLFAADAVHNQRKGFALLRDAMNALPEGAKVYFLSIGGGLDVQYRSNHIHLGNVNNDLLLSAIYSLADVFVIPSLEDNLPNTVIEAMACGTPVIGFDVGGIPDMVRPGQTGCLVSPGDVGALRDAIQGLLSDPVRRADMARQCRDVAVREYNQRTQAKRYAELYQAILGQTGRRGGR